MTSASHSHSRSKSNKRLKSPIFYTNNTNDFSTSRQSLSNFVNINKPAGTINMTPFTKSFTQKAQGLMSQRP